MLLCLIICNVSTFMSRSCPAFATLAWSTSKRSTLLSAVLLRHHSMKWAITPPDATDLVSFINASPTRNVECSKKRKGYLPDKP